jgi:hypothetical protein
MAKASGTAVQEVAAVRRYFNLQYLCRGLLLKKARLCYGNFAAYGMYYTM